MGQILRDLLPRFRCVWLNYTKLDLKRDQMKRSLRSLNPSRNGSFDWIRTANEKAPKLCKHGSMSFLFLWQVCASAFAEFASELMDEMFWNLSS